MDPNTLFAFAATLRSTNKIILVEGIFLSISYTFGADAALLDTIRDMTAFSTLTSTRQNGVDKRNSARFCTLRPLQVMGFMDVQGLASALPAHSIE